MNILKAFAMIALSGGQACADDHSPIEFFVEGQAIYADGDIDRSALNRFRKITAAHPDIKTLVLEYVGGSVDDEANVQLGKRVRRMGFTTVVPQNGLVASGGTDLFLAGRQRVLESGACVGVHAWAAEDFTARDLPRSHREHRRYLDYYKSIGIDDAFYWFTLDAAPAEDMHWMTPRETDRFGLSSNRPMRLGSARTCDRR